MATKEGKPIKYILAHGTRMNDSEDDFENSYIVIFGWGNESVEELRREAEESDDLGSFGDRTIDSQWAYNIKGLAETLSHPGTYGQYLGEKDIVTTIYSPIMKKDLFLRPVDHKDILKFLNAFPGESKVKI